MQEQMLLSRPMNVPSSLRILILGLVALLLLAAPANAQTNLVGRWKLSWKVADTSGSVTAITGVLTVRGQSGTLVHGSLSYLGKTVPVNGVIGAMNPNTVTGTPDGGFFHAVLTNYSGGYYRGMNFSCITPLIKGYQGQSVLAGTGVRQ